MIASPLSVALAGLLRESLAAWRLRGDVRLDDGSTVCVVLRDTTIRIMPADPDLPFRWMVKVAERSRPAVSVVAVLRQVRHAVDPGFRALRVRVAPPSVTPPSTDAPGSA